jgi:glycosyltransferase involved in cell wall biosynthesis
VEKVLTSRECKRIICWCELARDSIFAHLDSHTLRDKVEVVPHAVPPKAFTKRFDEHKIRLLFVGSGNIPGEFYSKGGNVVLEAFARLKQRYGNLELVMRSDVPPRIKKRYQGISGLRIIEDKLSKEELEREFLSADIFLFPGHQTPFMVLLEAMSYELPVIATDVYANREIVQDGRTGFLIPAASHVRYYVAELLPTGTGDWLGGRLKKDVQRLDPQMVANVVEKTAVLIESPGLRRRLGEAGRWEVEAGKFSLERRNEKLKAIFDEATEGESRMSST